MKVEKKLSDAHMRESSTSMLSEGQAEEIAKEVERVQSRQSSRKSSVKEEVLQIVLILSWEKVIIADLLSYFVLWNFLSSILPLFAHYLSCKYEDKSILFL